MSSQSRRVQDSKFLSLILRHEPQKIGLQLDEAGWADVGELLERVNAHGRQYSRESLEGIVFTCPKQRFSFNEDGSRIRANQGHTIEVELGLTPLVPPEVLFHGTVARFLESIRELGLVKGQRHHVHLSADDETAIKVAQRRGKPVILKVQSLKMHSQGHIFYRSANGVWLADHIPTEFIEFPDFAL